MRRLLAQILCLFISVTLSASDHTMAGAWFGKLKAGANSLRLVFHISPMDSSISMDSPDQGVKGIKCDILHLSADSVSCRIAPLMVKYDGKLSGDSIKGVFSQRGLTFPLVLTRGEGKVNRYQTPQPPFPYITEEITVSNDSVSLSGTLTTPEDADNSTHLVVLVSGSGLQNRDEELFEHKPFAVIADFLARNGIASYRYDDRGFGKSKGNALNATTVDFAADAQMVINKFRKDKKFGKIGLLGHSEGGQIAYMLAATSEGPDFIISVAGPSVKGSETIAFQNKVALMKSGINEETATQFEKAIEKAFAYKLAHTRLSEVSDSLLDAIYPQHSLTPVTRQLAASIKNTLTAPSTNPWMLYFLAYDPKADMEKIKVPALIIYGEKDRQVPPSLNIAPARSYLPSAKIISFPELNHLMQHAVTGNVEEYSAIDETISTEVLDEIFAFIDSL